MKLSKGLGKNVLYDQMLNSIDTKLLGHTEKSVTFKIVSDKSEIPETDHGNTIWIISKIPGPKLTTI